jgi:hypothetical protein
MDFRRYELPDERTLLVRVFDEAGWDKPQLGPAWELMIDGDEDSVGIGHPLDSNLAEVLGWDIAKDDWPTWVDQLAERIAADFGFEHLPRFRDDLA